MNLPKPCGDMYIKFDENNEPEYGFIMGYKSIEKFIKLSDKEIDTIILPPIVESEKWVDFPIEENDSGWMLVTKKSMMRDYVNGKLKIKNECFKGLKNLKIVVPFENSVMLDWGCFDRDAKVELVVPKNMTLKQIHRDFDTGFSYEHENWTLIADKNINDDFGWKGDENYWIENYDPEKLDFVVADLTVSHKLQEKESDKKSQEVERDRQ